ncbi:MAG TPA: hypothetical protein VIZ43_30380 [Trebonia sp.]
MDDTNYADWTWETVLGTVLNVAMPDRGAVTGQPWLVITHGDDTLPGAHEFWNASWTGGKTKAPGALSVYLNPALGDPDNPVSLFQAAPNALAGVPDESYSTAAYGPLPMQPPAFQAVGLALANATDWFGTATQHFNGLGRAAQAGGSGEAAQMFADLFNRLGTVAASLHDQMNGAVSYADAITDAAGGAAAWFLASLWSAYSNWTQQPAYTPAGAIVQVLQAVGQLQPDNTYVINDPEKTTYGDLTTDQGWAALEQQAKNRWLGLLTTGTGSFGGLDPLAHTALSLLISGYDRAVNLLRPVTGASPPAAPPPPPAPPLAPPPANGPGSLVALGPVPGLPPPVPPPVNGQVNLVALGPVPGLPPPVPPPVNGPVNLVAFGPVPGPPPPFPGRDPGNPPPVGPDLNVRNASVFHGPPNAPPPVGPGGGLPGPVIGGLEANAPVAPLLGSPGTPAPATAGGAADGTLVSAVPRPPSQSAFLSGPIGAVSNGTLGPLGDQAPPQAPPEASLTDAVLVPGAIGKPGQASDERKKSDRATPVPNKTTEAARLAPVAGAALGRSADGAVLPQATVPSLSAKPPSIRSSTINTHLTSTVTDVASPAGTGVGPAGAPVPPGGTPVRPGGPPDPVTLAAGPVHAANSNATAHDVVTTLVINQNGGPYGVNGATMPPQAALGGIGGGLGGTSMGRQRLSYRPEDEESWGTEPEETDAAVRAPHKSRQYQPTPEEEAEEVEIPSRFGAIGRRSQPS